ncbi:MAG: hypothetical protein ACKVP3_17105 [Hyphomicrobiaceae bacterium]
MGFSKRFGEGFFERYRLCRPAMVILNVALIIMMTVMATITTTGLLMPTGVCRAGRHLACHSEAAIQKCNIVDPKPTIRMRGGSRGNMLVAATCSCRRRRPPIRQHDHAQKQGS